jgi:hypothetical protein
MAAPALPDSWPRRWWRSPTWRQAGALAAIVVVSVGLRLATYNPIADGSGTRSIKTALVGGVAACLVWWLVRLQTAPASRLPLVAAVALLLSGDAVHYARLLNPITRGGPVRQFSPSFANEQAARGAWDFETTGAGTITYDAGALRLASPPGATAYVRGRLAPLPDVSENWWLPLGLAERERSEELTWRAAVQRTGGYYVAVEIRDLLIQVVSYGIHITYPDAGAKALRGHEIQHPLGGDGQVHEWRLSRASGQISLSVDGRPVWSAPQAGELDRVQFGETKADPQHGGTMRLEAVTYVARLERP